MMLVSVTRKVSVSCAHRLHNRELSTSQNNAIYGKCTSLHGHNYTVSVTWTGPINPHGMVIDITLAKQVLDDNVVAIVDHKCLDDLPYFTERPSTTENLCVFIKEQLGGVDFGTARITAISVCETDKNTFTITLP